MNDRGQLFLIVGNSGSGKDALLEEIRRRWPSSARPIRIPRRYITRAPHDSEAYVSVTPEAFEELQRRHTFWLTWHVYQTDYGIPAIILDWLKQGQHVIVNVSRDIIPQARKEMPELKVIFVTVPRDVALQRLKSRSRESEDDPIFQQRLQRAQKNLFLKEADIIVDNRHSLEIAAQNLIDYLLSFP